MGKLETLILKLKMMSKIKEVNMFFSQTGEDILINGVLQNQPTGFYVDIGAFDPVKFSNTYGFYIKGWHGINIDPNPESIKKFNIIRPKDNNINIGVSDVPGELTYFKFKEAAFNTFSLDVIKSYETSPIDKIPIKVERLDKILGACNIPKTGIDFMTIDTEGFDLKVLKSNDWEKYRPKVIAVEFDKNDNSIDCFLEQKSYSLICNTILTKVFLDKTRV
jgi:FkbM family methyltransferase